MERITDNDVPDEQLAFWDDVCQTQNVMIIIKDQLGAYNIWKYDED